jgi:hypothetical protein
MKSNLYVCAHNYLDDIFSCDQVKICHENTHKGATKYKLMSLKTKLPLLQGFIDNDSDLKMNKMKNFHLLYELIDTSNMNKIKLWLHNTKMGY